MMAIPHKPARLVIGLLAIICMQVTEVYARGRPTPQKLTDFQIIDLDDTDEIEVRPSDQGPLPRPLWRGNVAASATLGAMKETERGRRTAGPGQFVLHTFQEVGEGPALTGAGKAAVLAALEHAFSIWEDRVVLKRNLNVRFMWDYRLANRGALGAASPECMVGTAQIDGVQQSYPITFIQQMVDPTVTCNNERANHLRIRVNAGRDDWYFGTDGNTVRQFDLATVISHEIGHAMGFTNTAKVVDPSVGPARKANIPQQMDFFLYYPPPGKNMVQIQNIGTLFTMYTTAVVFRDPLVPVDVPMHTPRTFQGGSSVSHMHETAFPSGTPDAIMTPFIRKNEFIHVLGPLTLCMLEAMGWETTQKCTASNKGPTPTEISTSLTTEDEDVEESADTTMIPTSPTSVPLPDHEFADADGDGVEDSKDLCHHTSKDVLENPNRLHYWIWDGESFSATFGPHHGTDRYSIHQTHGCSCHQMLDTLSYLGFRRTALSNLYQFGCTVGVFNTFQQKVKPPGNIARRDDKQTGTVDQEAWDALLEGYVGPPPPVMGADFEEDGDGKSNSSATSGLVAGLVVGGVMSLMILIAVIGFRTSRKSVRMPEISLDDEEAARPDRVYAQRAPTAPNDRGI